MFKKGKKVGEQTAQESAQETSEVPVEEGPTQQKTYHFTMGNVQQSIVTLIDDEFNSMQVYEYLLPKDLMPGQIVTVTFRRNVPLQEERRASLDKIYKRIMKEDEFTKSNSILKD